MKNAPGPLDLWNAGLHAWCSAVHMQTEAMIRFWAAMGVWSHPPMARELAEEADAAAQRSKAPKAVRPRQKRSTPPATPKGARKPGAKRAALH